MTKQKEVVIAISMPDKEHFTAKKMTRDKEGHYTVINETKKT